MLSNLKVMKNLVIVMLSVALVVCFFSVRSMSSRASYWMNRCDAAESVIDRWANDDEDYFLDVIMESDEYMEWFDLGGNQ